MPKLLKNILQSAFFLGIGALLIWWALRPLTPEQRTDIKNSIFQANYWPVIPAFIIGVFSHLVRAVRWKLLMHPLGYNPKTSNTFYAVMIGYLANLAVPRLGEIARCGILARYEKIPADKLIGTMIAERAVDLLCLILVMFITVMVQIDVVGTFFSEKIWTPMSDKIASANGSQLVVMIGIAAVVVFLIYFLLKRFARSKAAIKLKALIRGVMEGILSIGKMQKKGWFIFHTVLIWVLYFGMLYAGFYCMKETSELGPKACLALLSFGSIAMIITPGGIGAYPIFIQQTLLLYNIHETSGYAFGWIVWGAQTILVFALGIYSVIGLAVAKKHTAATPA
ncbi:lysylphosphatidylglycerol synthase transmembrane domain-containing protein [uncultured Chitinophaga sp.]|uniref:lysylphosphatidylglycerol synthase transmembrane domain-containing protein n=1 Tax=uncultured Chitinophaga sp. TaxID=339340 RepID=UPI0025D2CC7D|nr:lysylphosphatidylglycerol synthase transmembrane domain-containing protein [uncultured Chitinophaga sp.]